MTKGTADVIKLRILGWGDYVGKIELKYKIACPTKKAPHKGRRENTHTK